MPKTNFTFCSALVLAGGKHELAWAKGAPQSFAWETRQYDSRPLILNFFDQPLKPEPLSAPDRMVTASVVRKPRT
jgi:hypothetical protein